MGTADRSYDRPLRPLRSGVWVLSTWRSWLLMSRQTLGHIIHKQFFLACRNLAQSAADSKTVALTVCEHGFGRCLGCPVRFASSLVFAARPTFLVRCIKWLPDLPALSAGFRVPICLSMRPYQRIWFDTCETFCCLLDSMFRNPTEAFSARRKLLEE